jgi:hypothetical protein
MRTIWVAAWLSMLTNPGCRDGTQPLAAPDGVPPLIGELTHVYPPAGSIVSSHRPLLRWRRPVDVSVVRVDLCADRACTNIVLSFATTAGEARTPRALEPGLVFWRVVAFRADGTAEPSRTTWPFHVRRRHTDTSTAWVRSLDWNGDGVADLALRRPGGVGIHLGSTTGVSSTPALVLVAPADGGPFGSSIAPAGDVNQDGAGDVAIGATGARHPDSRSWPPSGAVLLVAGGAPVLTPLVNVYPDPNSRAFAFGFSSGVGDFDGDSLEDLLIGSMEERDRGVVISRAGVFANRGAMRALGESTASPMLSGQHQMFGRYGFAAGADVNGDGYADVVIDTGRAFELYLGSADWLEGPAWSRTKDRDGGEQRVSVSPDLNGDGFDDLLVHTASGRGVDLYPGNERGLSDAPLIRISGPAGALHFGKLVAAGDFDGDGSTDLAVGGHGAWKVYVYSGTRLADGADATRIIEVRVGKDVISALHAADFDGDGLDDLAIVAPELSALEIPRVIHHPGSRSFFR